MLRRQSTPHASAPARPLRRPRPVTYPSSDGQPMAESDVHRQAIFRLIDLFSVFYEDEPLVYVSGDLLIYLERGNRLRHIAPDVFVALGVPKLPPRETYLLWEEGAPPTLVMEVTSRSTAREDQEKVAIYQAMGVREYLQYDPGGRERLPKLTGLSLMRASATPLATAAAGGLLSEALGLRFALDAGGQIHVYERASGRELLTRAEREAEARQREAEARQQEAEARQREAEARQRAEARVAELEARLRELEAGDSP